MKIRTYFFSFIFLTFLLSIFLVPVAGAANRIMPLGDSITLGSSSGIPIEDSDLWVSYRKALYDKLKVAGYVVDDEITGLPEIFVGTPSWIAGESVPDFDPDHEGHPGWRADEIVTGRTGSGEGKLSDWLIAEEPNIVLLHIGTNDVANGNEDWNEIEDILVVIDDYEFDSGKPVWVILALIIDRSCDPYEPPCPKSAETTAFNNAVKQFVFDPRDPLQGGSDKIILVDMQNGAGIDYDRWDMGGNMYNDLHPYKTGYAKMADLWFSGLMDILPEADAGDDKDAAEGTTPVTLDGSNSSDPNGTIGSYLWEQLPGGSLVQLTNAATDTATFTAPFVAAAGETLTFQLTVTDNDGLVSSDTVDVFVVDSPVANAGVDQDVTEGTTSVTLNGTGTGRNITFAWIQTGGPQAINFTGASTAAPTFTAPDINALTATLTFQLTVTDDLGTPSNDTVDVIVVDSPAANAGVDQDVTEGTTPVTLNGTGTGRNITFAWTQTGGPQAINFTGASTATPTFTAPDINALTATLTFQLTVTDDLGAISNDTVDVNVSDSTVTSTGGGGGGGGGCFINSMF